MAACVRLHSFFTLQLSSDGSAADDDDDEDDDDTFIS